MNRHFLFLAAALVPLTAIAQQVSSEAAMEIALQFGKAQAGAMQASSRNNETVTLTYTAQTGRNNDFYVFNYPDNKGFVIVSADTRTLQPVLAYSLQGSFDSGNIPSNAASVLSSYQEQIESLRTDNAGKKAPFLDPIPGATTIVVEPLIKTRWNQRMPYNGLCPIDRKYGQLSVTGCIATAMAQVMNYWKWPEKGHGMHYNYNDTTLFVNYDESVYDWNNTREEYNMDEDSAQTANIQKIMFDCGIAANMIYSCTGSSAFDTDISRALMTYFNYSSSTRLVLYNDIYAEYDNPDSVWISILKNEIDASRPVIMSGQDYVNGGGHAFICDGYDNRDYFHFNFGWGGFLDAYYLTSAINLSDGSRYNWEQSITIGIEPDLSGEWLDGYPVCHTVFGNLGVLDNIVTPYDTMHVLDIPESAVIDGKEYPVSIVATYAFFNNPFISEVKIPSSVYQLQDYCFYNCSGLETVQIPRSVIYFDYGVFGGCNNLKRLSVVRNNPYLYSPTNSNAVMERGSDRLLQGCNYTVIPSETCIIGSNSFEGFDGIETVVLPENVTDIESEAFYNCSNLKSVTLNAHIEAIGRDAFSKCPSLKDVYCLSYIPPQIQDTTFPSDITVHVVAGSGDIFRRDVFWSAFNIVEDIADPTYVEPLRTDDEGQRYWDIQGRSTGKAARGLRISKGRKYYFM